MGTGFWSGIKGVLIGAMLLSGNANAQVSQPIAAISSGLVKPVSVVCLAETEDVLATKVDRVILIRVLKDIVGGVEKAKSLEDLFRGARKLIKQHFPPVGGWFYIPIGTGFVVDAERKYVITNWHVARGCPRHEGAGTQIGIIEASGREITPILADLMEEPLKSEGRKGAAVPVKALCREKNVVCGKKSALEDVELFVPDLAVLKLRDSAQTLPIPLAIEAPSPGADLEFLGFPQVVMNHLSQASGGLRMQVTEPIRAPAKLSGMVVRDNIRPGMAEIDVVRIQMMMLAAQVHRGNSGGPVLANGKVAGVITASLFDDNKIPVGYGLAVPSAKVTELLDWFGIKPVAQVDEVKVGETSQPELPVAEKNWWEETRNQLLLALAACLLIAGGAFVVMLKRRTEENISSLPQPDTVVVPSPPAPAQVSEPLAPTKPVYGKVELSLSHCSLAGKTFTLPLPNGSLSAMTGRNPDSCQIVFANEDAAISGTHACFAWDDAVNKLRVEDMRSTNGTFVNGRKLKANEPTTLMPGDTVDLGVEGKNRFSIRLL